MMFSRVHFKKFEVEPATIFATLPAYKPSSWPLDWEVAFVPNGDVMRIHEWSKDHLDGHFDIAHTHDGDVLVGFSNPTDAILFKISYTNGVTE